MRSGDFKVFGSRSSLFTGPAEPGVRPYLQVPRLHVHFGEVATERFSGIIREERGEAVGASQQPLTERSHALFRTLNI